MRYCSPSKRTPSPDWNAPKIACIACRYSRMRPIGGVHGTP